MKHYGYKICYSEKGHKRDVKPFFYARSYKQALRMKDMYIRFEQHDRDDCKRLLNKPTWYIVPIMRREVVRGIWREVPF